jgi:hypothetical protein
VDDEASNLWRRGQNIRGVMPKNILGTARMVSFAKKWVKTQKAAFRRPFVFFQGNVSLAKLHGFFLYNCRRGCEAHRSSAKIIKRSFRFFEMPLPSAPRLCK